MITKEDILSSLSWRYACKKYDSTKKISAQDLAILKESLRLAPSSYGLQPWKFVIVENPELRKKLREASWGQPQVTDASHLIAVVAREKMEEADVDKLIQKNIQVRGTPLEALKGYRDMMIGDIVKGPRSGTSNFWTQRQAYIALGFVLQTAAHLRIDSTPMEGIDPAAYDKLLGLEGSGWKTVVAIALGYRANDDVTQNFKKVRYDEKDIFITK